MYLTGGQYKGHKIEIPKTAKPTLSKVRESVFNMLIQFDFEDNKFLDMFAGSAIMGLEAISRGYCVTEIEIDFNAAKIIKKNYEKLKLNPDLKVCNALKFSEGKYDIIYLDPPWNTDYKEIIKHSANLLRESGILVIEHDNLAKIDLRAILGELNLNLEIVKSKKYGRCLIDILR